MSDMYMYGMKITPIPKNMKPKMVRIKRNKNREEARLKVLEECIKASRWNVRRLLTPCTTKTNLV